MFTKMKNFKNSYRNLASWLLNQGLRLPQSERDPEEIQIIENLSNSSQENTKLSHMAKIFQNIMQRRLYRPFLILIIGLFILPIFIPALKLIADLVLWIVILFIALVFFSLYLSLADVWAATHPDKIYDRQTRFQLKNDSYENSLAVVTTGKWYEKIIYSNFLRGFIQLINSGWFQWTALIIIFLPNNFQDTFLTAITNIFFVVIIVNIFSNSKIIQYRRNHNLPSYSYLPLSEYFAWTSILSDLLFVLWLAAQIADILHELI
ncbi:hypothetical protein [Oenococcus sicerae]|uniref:hypothetical protein n=1 Tax=Oenococcus sicerae TaxID=2203724 RepID=UPI0039E84C39